MQLTRFRLLSKGRKYYLADVSSGLKLRFVANTVPESFGRNDYLRSMSWSDYFDVDFVSGILTWKVRDRSTFNSDRGCAAFNSQYVGTVAGSTNSNAYVQVKLNGKLYKAHRIVFEMAHGPIEEGKDIDHIDGVRTNNALANLRSATRSQNKMNGGKQANNTSGAKGVSRYGTKWRTYISIGGKNTCLGIFKDVQSAAQAYLLASRIHHGEFSRT